MKYPANFASHEEYIAWRRTGKMPKLRAQINYLKVEPINGNSVMFKAVLDYRHASPYQLELGDWTYLTKNDLRSISPFIDYREKKMPFYITFGESFYEVRDIRSNENDILELVLQHAGLWNLN